MSDANRLTGWIDGYVRAWDTNDPRDIGDLFTDDAVYYTAPFRPPWRGRDKIVAGWLDRKDEPGDAEFDWEPLVVTPEVAVVQGTTRYRDPAQTYSNLWVIRLDGEGRASEFTEWWMDQGAPDSD
jgi:uncharacterized protein (TIGR02246 family)